MARDARVERQRQTSFPYWPLTPGLHERLFPTWNPHTAANLSTHFPDEETEASGGVLTTLSKVISATGRQDADPGPSDWQSSP